MKSLWIGCAITLSAALVVAGATGCAKQTNAAYCDVDTQCTDPARPICDFPRNRCLAADEDAGTCAAHSECTDLDRPICDTAGACRACGTHAECLVKDDGIGICDENGRCVAGCDVSTECPGSAPICGGEGICTLCDDQTTGDADCATRADGDDRCAADGTCVECLVDGDCSGTTPICDTTVNTCRGCADHDECTGEVCDFDTGSCPPEGDIIYVDVAGGDDDGACGAKDDPCKTIDGSTNMGALPKVTSTRKWIKLEPGTYVEAVTISDGETVFLVGEANVVISPPNLANSAGIVLSGSGTLSIDRVAVRGATGGINADGIRCSSGSTLTVRRSTISTNQATGIKSFECDVTIERSTISTNTGGGISVTDAPFTIINNFIIENGSGISTTFGGVRINNSGAISPQVFDFNTVARNQSMSAASSNGVECNASGVTAKNNIVWGGVGGSDVPVDGNCNWTYSDIEAVESGDGNIMLDPMFVNAGGSDYKLMGATTSPCRDAADPGATVDEDFFGAERPDDTRSDMGAHEVHD